MSLDATGDLPSPVDDQPRAVSVSQLTHHIKQLLEGTFPAVWVAGEISDLTRAASGHLYFTLKDDRSQIRGIIWQSTAARMKTKITEGMAAICCGDVEVYAPRGTYQLIVRKVMPQGLGSLQQAFEQLKAKLHAEGLFSAERKRPLPKFPRRIAVITSPAGAAIRDFLQAASNRWRGVEIIVVPALVQGTGAAESIVRAIDAANQLNSDVVVVTRGGGSLEDLWSFNEEIVVRAVAQSSKPTVSAVGHEIDVTLCDLASDFRALTPTDAATQVLPDASDIGKRFAELNRRLHRSARSQIESRRALLDALASRTALRRPHEWIHDRSRYLDELEARARRAMLSRLQLARQQLATAAASLSALSPLDVLTRGYSVTLDSQGRVISDARDVHPGDRIRTRLNRGEIESTVEKVIPPES